MIEPDKSEGLDEQISSSEGQNIGRLPVNVSIRLSNFEELDPETVLGPIVHISEPPPELTKDFYDFHNMCTRFKYKVSLKKLSELDLEQSTTPLDELIMRQKIRVYEAPDPLQFDFYMRRYYGGFPASRIIIEKAHEQNIPIPQADFNGEYRETKASDKTANMLLAWKILKSHFTFETFQEYCKQKKVNPDLDYLRHGFSTLMSSSSVETLIQGKALTEEGLDEFYLQASSWILELSEQVLQKKRDKYVAPLNPYPILKDEEKYLPNPTALVYIYNLYRDFYDIDNLAEFIKQGQKLHLSSVLGSIKDLNGFANKVFEKAIRDKIMTYDQVTQFVAQYIEPFAGIFEGIAQEYLKKSAEWNRLPPAPTYGRLPSAQRYRDRLRSYGMKVKAPRFRSWN